jgi:hypothetical protein
MALNISSSASTSICLSSIVSIVERGRPRLGFFSFLLVMFVSMTNILDGDSAFGGQVS